MIRSVFIIHESGLCLFSRAYRENSKNIDLFSGLLFAVSSFAKNMIGEKINEIKTEHHNIYYESKKTIVIALVTSKKKITKRKLTMIMRRISNNFVQQYEEYLKLAIIEPQIFESFSTTIDKIFQSSDLIKIHYPLEKEKVISGIHQ
ncbi:MAG: hypothetical protein ACFFB5_03785 [Promethearchaeota archaeon]